MNVSQACIDLVKHFEGCRLDAYEDDSPAKIPTIGYGHTGSVKLGDSISQERAEELLAQDLASFATQVSGAVHIPIAQHQFDALVAFAYNVKGWRISTLFHMVNTGNFTAAAAEFPKWCHAGTRVLNGLVARRAAEQKLFLG